MEIIKGVEDVATQNGMSVVLTESGNRHAPGPEWIEGVMRRRPVGVVLVFSDLPHRLPREAASSRAIPFVIIDPAGDPSPDVPSVGLGQLVGRADGDPAPDRARPHAHRRDHRARRHDVLARAHRRLPLGDERPRAWRSAPTGSASATSTSTAAASHGRELLELAEPPTAIFAGSDLQALGVLEAARAPG